MGAPPPGGEVTRSGFDDLVTFNHWLCLTRLRAAGAVMLFTLSLAWLRVGSISTPHALAVCAGLVAVSGIGLGWPRLARAPRLFFYLQSLADLAAITVGIGISVHGVEALLFRSVYALTIVPASLISVPSGLAMAAAATIGHEMLLVHESGLASGMLYGVESLLPPFLFFLLAQQCFFYGAHLKRKNTALATLADRLEESHQRLRAEARTSAALLDVARTLSSTLEAPELLARVNSTTCQQLGADWSATFLIDAEQDSFRLVAVTDADGTPGELARFELPLSSWAPVGCLATQPLLVLTGAEAERTPGLGTRGGPLSTTILAALYRDRVLAGFLAVGFRNLSLPEREQAVDLISGIAQHATIVLRNARLLEEVRRASAMKSEFVSAVSHELRSPLNVILGYLEMTLDGAFGPVNTEQRHALRRTQEQSVALLEMITALLDVNRLEAGRLPVQRAQVSVVQLLEEICEQLPETWRRPEVQLRRALAPGLPAIETDAGKLKTVVRNLLHNAFKFTERGHVTLGAGLTPAGDLAITVADTGCGIPPDAIHYIFDMFRQVPGSSGGGVGLGLHLVRRLLHVLGGTVSVASEVGKGTCFTVILPLAATTGQRPRRRPPRPIAPSANAA
ncbi:MAG TPA: ATP-binding protein [Verrucomicrobiae bacterium]|nr:ATP-binding protein [Verrucomicrobiae bacterium]